MKIRKKHLSFLVIVTFILLLATACGTTRTRPINYNLNLEVAGEGAIRESGGEIITATETTISLSRNSIIEIEAEAFAGSDFLFWTGDIGNNIMDVEQSVLINRNKEVIAVFGNSDEIFMSGYITESWGSTDIIGYWKALTEDPKLEVYLRRTIGNEEEYRYIFDEGDTEEGRIVYHQPDLANSEYIAALIRVEESNILETGEESKYLFIYIDLSGFTALVKEYSPSTDEIYQDLLDLDEEEFIEEIKKLIKENRNEDIILGNTVNIFDHDF